jgi:serine/threonine protein kinase
LDIIRNFIGDYDADPSVRKEFQRKGFASVPYCIVMEAGERSLYDILYKEHITELAKKSFSQQIAQALEHMHEKGFIHGDVKPKV